MYCETSRSLALKQRYGEVRVLVQAVQKSHPPSRGGQSALEELNDDIIMAAIKVLANQSKEVSECSYAFVPKEKGCGHVLLPAGKTGGQVCGDAQQ